MDKQALIDQIRINLAWLEVNDLPGDVDVHIMDMLRSVNRETDDACDMLNDSKAGA